MQTINSTSIPILDFEAYPNYEGKDLGITYTKEKTTLKVWSPAVTQMRIHLYKSGHEGKPFETHAMAIDTHGVWSITLEGNWHQTYYTVQSLSEGRWLREVPDPYAVATGVNGERGMIVDLNQTNPENWANDNRPILKSYNDIIIYELHVRDLSSHVNSGIKQQGKFLGLTELNTKSPEGLATGLSHLKELGVTHIHLLPVFDFLPRSVDERHPKSRFNWGYDPQNYNVPEGSYSTNPYDGSVRIKEFKKMVQTLHQHGFRVIMDVVYNHTGETEPSNFNQVTPFYYYRFNEDGTFSDASACGNETASERYMMRKFMIESMSYWAMEYHIDGFRVDLMGIHDIETMNQISTALEQIDSTIFVYGEGWTGGDSPLPKARRTIKHHTTQLNRIAAFSDDMRDGLKGSVFDTTARGFVSGLTGTEESIKFGIVASTQHQQIDYAKVNYSDKPWANQPKQTINYASCHDNHTLYDKLMLSCKGESEAEILKMHRLANTIVLTSQGIPFLHAGTELARTKQGVENSYESPDEINQFDWTRKSIYHEHFEFYKKLIALRKNHLAFKMPSKAMIQKHLQFLDIEEKLTVGYQISDYANGDSWKNILVLFNGNIDRKTVKIPLKTWKVVVDGIKINEKGIATKTTDKAQIQGRSALILIEN